jgi:vitamin-K-epoxide reductase (warfarin-sensitive)
MRPAVKSQGRWILLGIVLLSAAGVAVSAVALHQHYQKDETSFCDIGANFNCDIVNRSIYSEVMGIPVAGIGIAGYLALLVLATVLRARAEAPPLLLLGSLAGLGFALYLTYIEKYVLATWCILCLSSLALISGIAILSVALAVMGRRRADTLG